MLTPLRSPPDRWHAARLGLSVALTVAAMLFSTAMIIEVGLKIRGYQQQQDLLRQQQQEEQRQQDLLTDAENAMSMGRYSDCIAATQQISFGSSHYNRAQILKTQCQVAYARIVLQQAQDMANAGQFQDAITHLQQIAPDVAPDVVHLWRIHWSQELLKVAENQYRSESDQFREALLIAQSLPVDNPLYGDAQKKIDAWRQEWSQNQQHLRAAHTAIAVEAFDTALSHLGQITDHPYWQQQAEALRETIDQRQQQAAAEEAEKQQRMELLLLGLITIGVSASVVMSQSEQR